MPAFDRMIPIIRPITDLRAHLNEVLAQASSIFEPIIFTKNGIASCALMSIEALDARFSHAQITLKLREAEIDFLYRDGVFSIEYAAQCVREVLAALNVSDNLFDAIQAPAYEPGSCEISFSSKAIEDLEGIAAYTSIELKRPEESSRQACKLFSLLADIAKTPQIGRPVHDVNLDRVYRELRLDDFYIFYTFGSGALHVWRVIDPLRNIDRQYVVESI